MDSFFGDGWDHSLQLGTMIKLILCFQINRIVRKKLVKNIMEEEGASQKLN